MACGQNPNDYAGTGAAPLTRALPYRYDALVADKLPALEELLDEADRYVGRMPATPGARELKARLEKYRRTMGAWPMHAPTDEQRVAMREQLGEVLRIARNTAPTLRRRVPTE